MRSNVIPIFRAKDEDETKPEESAYWKGIRRTLAIIPTSDRDLVTVLDVALDGLDAEVVSAEIEVALVRRARDYLAARGTAPAA